MLEIRSMILLLVSALPFVLACNSENKSAARTQVLLVIDSDLDDLASIEVRVQDAAGESEGSAHTFVLSDKVELPVSLTIVPSAGKTSSEFRVVARGLDEADKLLVESKVYGRFVPGKRAALSLWLRAACRGVSCGDDQTCNPDSAQGACSTIPTADTDELPVADPRGDDENPTLTAPSDRMPDAGAASATSEDASAAAKDDAAVDGAAGAGADAAVVVPHVENVPTLGAFSTLQEARRKGAQGGATGYLLFDDGFEVGETSCNSAGLCLTGSFAP